VTDEYVPTIEGLDLKLRPFRLDDVPAVTLACQDEEISRWTASIPYPYEESHARTWIESHDRLRQDRAEFPFAIVDQEDRLLGSIGLIQPGTPPGCGTVGYWVAAWARNHGVATRALLMLSEWAEGSFSLKRLELVTKLGNVASERVAARAGYALAEEMSEYEHPESPGQTFPARRWVRTSTPL
jgi:RimJ/RimL family protein N-acetyltransferase